jgi:hypothetical protein
MSAYVVTPEADGTYSVHVEEFGSLSGRYIGFKSKGEADQWISKQQKGPDLPPSIDKNYPGI